MLHQELGHRAPPDGAQALEKKVESHTNWKTKCSVGNEQGAPFRWGAGREAREEVGARRWCRPGESPRGLAADTPKVGPHPAQAAQALGSQQQLHIIHCALNVGKNEVNVTPTAHVTMRLRSGTAMPAPLGHCLEN